MAEKTQLLAEGWEVTKTPEKPPFAPGAKVRTKGRAPRTGIILERATDQIKWVIQYDDGDIEEKPFQSLVQDWSAEPYIVHLETCSRVHFTHRNSRVCPGWFGWL